MSSSIETVGFDLSLVDDEGFNLRANTYTVPGVENADGSLRELSIGQLVMALCLQRAAELEESVIGLMNTMDLTSAQLAALTEIEQKIVDTTSGTISLTGNSVTVNGKTYTYAAFFDSLGISYSSTDVNADSSDLINAIESQMDSMNSFSQQSMIELQSFTNKRDQSYDMISNILKSLYNQLSGNVNNL
ncbi:MAG: hypothetical protein K6F50_04455 [Kiritimatiellae bacterium]|nr:hypothetical protein [Kiritimatiellia bacterium]